MQAFHILRPESGRMGTQINVSAGPARAEDFERKWMPGSTRFSQARPIRIASSFESMLGETPVTRRELSEQPQSARAHHMDRARHHE